MQICLPDIFFNSYEIGSIKLVNGALARYKKAILTVLHERDQLLMCARTKLFPCEQKTACAMSNWYRKIIFSKFTWIYAMKTLKYLLVFSCMYRNVLLKPLMFWLTCMTDFHSRMSVKVKDVFSDIAECFPNVQWASIWQVSCDFVIGRDILNVNIFAVCLMFYFPFRRWEHLLLYRSLQE